jgi:hypothetical protein
MSRREQILVLDLEETKLGMTALAKTSINLTE